MYSRIKFRDRVRVPPQFLGMEVEDSIRESLEQELVGEINPELGIVLGVDSIEDIGDGDIKPEEAGVFYPITCEVMSFRPEVHEVVVGEVSEITEFGAFVDLGPVEALCHVSQIMDDYVSYNEEQDMLSGEDGDKTLQKGDVVKARITGVSLNEEGHNKINLTMRQPGLGKLEWIEEEEEEEE